jgi:hypothetical protein
VDLSGNQLTAFPPASRLPPTLKTINLGHNPLRDGADHYNENLLRVTLGHARCNVTSLNIPPSIKVVTLDVTSLQCFERASQFIEDNPYAKLGILSIDDIKRGGWTAEMIRNMCDPIMLKYAVQLWLGDKPANNSWLYAQNDQPFAALTMAAILHRLQDVVKTIESTDFHQRLIALLDKMQQENLFDEAQQKKNKLFQSECLAIAQDGAESCDDRLLDTLNNLEIAAQNADAMAGLYDKNIAGLLKKGEKMLSLHVAAQFITDLMPELNRRAKENARAQRGEGPSTSANASEPADDTIKADEIEQFLMLQTQLNDTTALEPTLFEMKFGALSLLTPADIEKARHRISDERNTGFIPFLGTWAPLESVIRRTAPELSVKAKKMKDRIINDRGRLYKLLERLPKALRRRFIHEDPHNHTMAFKVRERRFWTRYDHLVDRLLTKNNLNRNDPDVLAEASKVVSDDFQAMIQDETVRQFLSINEKQLASWSWTEPPTQPDWFKRLLHRI